MNISKKPRSADSLATLDKLFGDFTAQESDPTLAIDKLPAKQRVTPLEHTQRCDESRNNIEHTGASPKGRTLLSPTGLKYLTVAVEKNCEPLHPNFRRALKPKSLAVILNARHVLAAAYDANGKDAKKSLLAAAVHVAKERAVYVSLWTSILADAAFAAHMDALALEREGTAMTESDIADTMRLMDESNDTSRPASRIDREMHGDVETSGTPAFDAGHSAPSEPYEGGEQQPTIATDIDDAYEAIEGLQQWCSLAFSKFTPDDLDYWNLHGGHGDLRFMQEKVEHEDGKVEYRAVDNFNEYRELQTKLFKAKRNAATFTPDVMELMAVA